MRLVFQVMKILSYVVGAEWEEKMRKKKEIALANYIP